MIEVVFLLWVFFFVIVGFKAIPKTHGTLPVSCSYDFAGEVNLIDDPADDENLLSRDPQEEELANDENLLSGDPQEEEFANMDGMDDDDEER